jgi:hypothetical protein
MAEVGFYDLDLITHRERLLMIHRAINNPLDTKTKALLQTATNQGDQHHGNLVASAITSLNLHLLPTTFLSIPYLEIKLILKRALFQAQQLRWRSHINTHPTWTHRHFRCKLQWGLDSAVSSLPNDKASAYIFFRLNSHPHLLAASRNVCRTCAQYAPTTSHYLWHCPPLSPLRQPLLQTLRQTLTQTALLALAAMEPEDLTDFVLGTGASTTPTKEWTTIVHATAEFIMNINNYAAEQPR